MTKATTVPGGLEAREPAVRPERSPAEIEAEIEATRDRLAGTVDAIADQLKPANVVRHSLGVVKGQFVDRDGNLRAKRVAVLAVVVAAFSGLVIWRRSR